MNHKLLLVTGFIALAVLSSAQNQKPEWQNNVPNTSLPGNQQFLFDNDGGIGNISAVPAFECNTTLTPSILLVNDGTNNLTTATIEYSVDGLNTYIYNWNGILMPNASINILLPQITVSPGSHELTVDVTQANGVADINNSNDSSISFTIIGQAALPPLQEGFESGMLADGFFAVNPDQDVTWNLYSGGGAFGTSSFCMQMPFYHSNQAFVDEFFIRNIDMSGLMQPTLTFDKAYARYSSSTFGSADRLRVYVSTDCGGSWALMYDKAGIDLQTTGPTTAEFFPNSENWNSETVDLGAFSGYYNVLIKFQGISDHGNDLYIDNINLSEPVGISEVAGQGLFVGPNPASDQFMISYSENAVAKMYSADGKLLRTFSVPQGNSFYALADIVSGNYLLTLTSSGGNVLHTKLIVVH